MEIILALQHSYLKLILDISHLLLIFTFFFLYLNALKKQFPHFSQIAESRSRLDKRLNKTIHQTEIRLRSLSPKEKERNLTKNKLVCCILCHAES